MKSIIFITISLLVATCSTRNIVPYKEEDESGEIKILVLVDNDDNIHFLDEPPPSIRSVEVNDSEITFYYSSRETAMTELFVFNVDELVNTDFNPYRRNMFIIHGWNNDKDSKVNTVISEALLDSEDWNIFVVDWREKANSIYTTALGAVPGVGDVVAKFITRLRELTNIPLQKINLCGHSLGAHVAGRVGSIFNGQVETIIGLDPALPFVQNDTNSHLDPTDAQYVQVIHTNAGFLGFSRPIGHSDFYPNGGMNQKGCGIDAFGKCAHSRSYKYFAESIVNHNFKGRYCESNTDWKNGKCDQNEIGYMGGNILDRVFGTFYLDTAPSEPFALG